MRATRLVLLRMATAMYVIGESEQWTLDHYEGDGDLQEDGEEDP